MYHTFDCQVVSAVVKVKHSRETSSENASTRASDLEFGGECITLLLAVHHRLSTRATMGLNVKLSRETSFEKASMRALVPEAGCERIAAFA